LPSDRQARSAATPSQHFWLREVEHVKELLGSGLWQEKMLGRELPTEFEDAWKVLDALLADVDGQVQFGIYILAKVPHESGIELVELIEQARGAMYDH
jgi:hypothetical protein